MEVFLIGLSLGSIITLFFLKCQFKYQKSSPKQVNLKFRKGGVGIINHDYSECVKANFDLLKKLSEK